MSCASGRGSGASVGRPREGGKEGGKKGGAGAAAAVAARKWRGPPAASVPGFEEGAELTRLRSRWGCDISGPPRAALPRARPDGGGHRPPSPSHPGLRVARRSLSPSRGCHRAHPAALGFAPKGTRSSKDRDVGALLSHWGHRWGDTGGRVSIRQHRGIPHAFSCCAVFPVVFTNWERVPAELPVSPAEPEAQQRSFGLHDPSFPLTPKSGLSANVFRQKAALPRNPLPAGSSRD